MNNLLKDIMNGYDGLIRRIEFDSFDNVSITISAMKIPQKKWINVKFKLSGLKEFVVRQKLNSSNVVLSGGIVYKEINGVKYIDFSPYSEIMENEDDFRMSDLYFSADNISFEFLPYCE